VKPLKVVLDESLSMFPKDMRSVIDEAIQKALADARDEALTKACDIVHRATFADGKIQMDGEDLEGEIRRAYLAAAHPEGKT
jgi:hypothetical protein